jgi:N-acetylglucosamine-6-phosphate deacetylase
MQKAYSASQVFNGEQWLQNYAVIVNDGLVDSVVPQSEVPADIDHQNFDDALLVPAFIDAQVYGAGGRLLAAYPDAASLRTMHEQFAKEGTCLFQPTIATNTIEVFKQCIDAVRAYWLQGGKGVHGLHLEGPWLNAEKRGAHVKEWIHSPSVEEVKDLLEYGKDVITMITIAPEICSDDVIQLIHSYKVVVSAGHSSATYTQATESFGKGITTVTHLYNAMSALHHREPGLVGATLNHPKVRSSIIPDGHHVDYAAIKIAKNLMGERLFAITDAVTETSIGPYQHHLAGDKYESNGILSGSAISMHQAFYNLAHHVGVGLGEALRMCSLYPAQVLNRHQEYGEIGRGFKAQFVVLNRGLRLTQVIT